MSSISVGLSIFAIIDIYLSDCIALTYTHIYIYIYIYIHDDFNVIYL